MEILVAILIIALIAAAVYIVLQRRAGGAPQVGAPHASPLGRRDRGARHGDSMAAAVHAHAQATDPADVVAAEQRLQAQARNVAASMGANNGSHATAYADPSAGPAPGYAPVQPAGSGHYASASAAASADPNLDRDFDPVTGERVDGFEDPANDPRLNDPKYDGRLAADWVDPREDDRYR